MLTNRPSTATTKASISHRLTSVRPADDDQRQDADQEDHHHPRKTTHRQPVEKPVTSSRHVSRTAVSGSVETRRSQGQDPSSTASAANHHPTREHDRERERERESERDNRHHRHVHSSRHGRSTSRQRSHESSRHVHSRHHHHHQHHHHQQLSQPPADEVDESREVARLLAGHRHERGRERNHHHSPLDRPQSRQSSIMADEEDLANVSIRTNPGKKDGSGLLTVRDILEDPELQMVTGSSRGGWYGELSQPELLQQRTQSRPSIQSDGIGQGASSSSTGGLVANGKTSQSVSRRTREPQVGQHSRTQHRGKSSRKPSDMVETAEEHRRERRGSFDQSAAVKEFQARLDEAERQARQKSVGVVNGVPGSRSTLPSVPRMQTSHPTIQLTAASPSMAKERLKEWAEFTIDDSVYTATVDEQDEDEDDDDDDDDEDTDVTQKTAERIPSTIHTMQPVSTVSKTRPLQSRTTTVTAASSSAIAKRSKEKYVQPRHAHHQQHQQPPEMEIHDNDVENALDGPGNGSSDWLDEATAAAKARRIQRQSSTSNATRSSSADARKSTGEVRSNHIASDLLSVPMTSSSTIKSKSKNKSPTASSSKSPPISPRLTSVEGGLRNAHRPSMGWPLRKDYPQSSSSAMGTTLSQLPLTNLSIPPSNLSAITTTTSATTAGAHVRGATLDHGRDLALEDLASPTSQDPMTMGVISSASRRGSKKSTLLVADEDDRYPRPSIMSSYLRMSDSMQPRGYAETEHRFLELAGSIGEGQAVSNVFGTLKDKIRTLRQKQKSSTLTIKGLQKELKKAQRELARERREKDALSASLSALPGTSEMQSQKSHDTKVEQDIESLQQRIEALERERDVAATKKEALIQQRQKKLLFLDADSSDDDADLVNDDSDSDDDSNDDDDEEHAAATASRSSTTNRRRKEDMAPAPGGRKTITSSKDHDKRRDPSMSLESAITGMSSEDPSASATTGASSSLSLRRSQDARRGQAKTNPTGEQQQQQPNMVRFEVPLPSNMRASQVVYLPSLSHSLSALAPLSALSPVASPLPGPAGHGDGVKDSTSLPEAIFASPATTAAATAAAIAALSSSTSSVAQNDPREVHIHHHVHISDDGERDRGASVGGGGHGKMVVRTSERLLEESSSASKGKGKGKGKAAETTTSMARTRPKTSADTTAIEAIDMLRRSIGHRESPSATSGGRRSGSVEPDGEKVARQQHQQQRGDEQNHPADSDPHTQSDAVTTAARDEEHGLRLSQGVAGRPATMTAISEAGEAEEEEEEQHEDRVSDENIDLEDQSMIDSDVEGRPRRVHIDMDRVLSLLKAHHEDRCVVCRNQPSDNSLAHHHQHDHAKEARRTEAKKRYRKPISSENRQSLATVQSTAHPPPDAEEPQAPEYMQGSVDPQPQHQEEDEDEGIVDRDTDGNAAEDDGDDVGARFHQGLIMLEEEFRELHEALEDAHGELKRSQQADPKKLAAQAKRVKAIEQQLKQVEQLIKAKAHELHELQQQGDCGCGIMHMHMHDTA
ncbi:hypothetical protein BGZ73_004297 [Actinomortierella ambigua]|nr:hypothetical protein BGZ73_004297 [Actinomortierella ambigua]